MTGNIKNSDWAVVTFIEECNDDELFTSEVPSCWLMGESKCYWPNRKNVVPYITKQVKPVPNSDIWSIHEVEVLYFCDSLESARKKAGASSSDESLILEKKSRRRKKNSKFHNSETSSSSDEHVLDATMIPKFPEGSGNNATIKGTETITVCPPEAGVHQINKRTKKNLISSKARTLVELTNKTDYCGPSDTVSSFGSESISYASSSVPISVNHFDDEPAVSAMENLQNIPIMLEINALTEVKSHMDNQFEKQSKLLKEINMNLFDFNRRLERIENTILKGKMSFDKDEIKKMLDLLPLNTIADIQAMESLLSEHTSKQNLVNYLSNVGGSCSKDNIIRILKKTFTNCLSTQCSWLGQRNNYPLHKLIFTGVIKDAVCENYPHSDKEFENVVSEWFRQGKLRLTRETKSFERKNAE